MSVYALSVSLTLSCLYLSVSVPLLLPQLAPKNFKVTRESWHVASHRAVTGEESVAVQNMSMCGLKTLTGHDSLYNG